MGVQIVVFAVCAVVALLGALGVVFARNPVHSALGLVATLFAIAVLFVNQNAQFLGVVQVIVYTGAIVVLILFVIMLLGVDTDEDLDTEPLLGQRWAAVIVALLLIGGIAGIFFVEGRGEAVTGQVAALAPIVPGIPSTDAQGNPTTAAGVDTFVRALPAEQQQAIGEQNITQIGEHLFTDYVFAFMITAALLTIAVIGAVLMARRPKRYEPMPELEDTSCEDVDELSTTGEVTG